MRPNIDLVAGVFALSKNWEDRGINQPSDAVHEPLPRAAWHLDVTDATAADGRIERLSNRRAAVVYTLSRRKLRMTL
jgi:hypothetical protein